MGDQTFIESDLRFNFNEDWIVKKYDEHSYFKTLAGFGLKGVDFIGIYKMEAIYLIEVKNYKTRSYSPVEPDWIDISGDEPPLINIFQQKIEDSLKLIRVVNKYLKRQWWYYPANWLRGIMRDDRLNKDWKFWSRVQNMIDGGVRPTCILCLELDQVFLDNENKSESIFIDSLNKKLKTGKSKGEQKMLILSTNSNDTMLSGMTIAKEDV